MEKPIVIGRSADNGELSHWELIDTASGSVLWSEDEENCLQKKTDWEEVMQDIAEKYNIQIPVQVEEYLKEKGL